MAMLRSPRLRQVAATTPDHAQPEALPTAPPLVPPAIGLHCAPSRLPLRISGAPAQAASGPQERRAPAHCESGPSLRAEPSLPALLPAPRFADTRETSSLSAPVVIPTNPSSEELPEGLSRQFRFPRRHCLVTACAAVGLVVTAMLSGEPSLPYGEASVAIKVVTGFLFVGLGALLLLSVALDLRGTGALAATWVVLGVVATAYARSAAVSWRIWLFAGLLGAFVHGVIGINRAWKGIWSGTRRNSLNLSLIWACFGLILIVGYSLAHAQRQGLALAGMGLFLTPWGARLAGWGLRKLALTTQGRLDWGKALFAGGVCTMVVGAALHRGALPHVLTAGMTLPLHDVARWLVSGAFAVYIARRPHLDRRTLAVVLLAFSVIAVLYLGVGERYSIVLLLLVTSVVAASVWGIQRTAVPFACLVIAGFCCALVLAKMGTRLPLERMTGAVGATQNQEISRAKLALATAGWTGISGAHTARLSFQSVTDYAVSTIALNYGRIGLLFALTITFVQICLLFVSSAQLPNATCRLLALSLVANVAVQALLPVLAMTPWPVPYGGIPWCLAARSIGQLALQLCASAAIIGAVHSRPMRRHQNDLS